MSTISSLSAGEFVGMVADNPGQPINLKTFHSTIINDHEFLKSEKESQLPLPKGRSISEKEINVVYQIIKQDIKDIVGSMIEDILNDKSRRHLIVKKK